MPTATQSRLGIMIREIRERAGLTREKFADFLNLKKASVQRLEAGTSKLLSDRSFYKRLLDVPGFTYSDVTKMLLSSEYASDWFAEINQREHTTFTQLRSEGIDAIDKYLVHYPSANLDPHEPIQLAFSDDFSIVCGIQPDRKRRYLIIYVTDYDTIRLQTVSAWMERGEQRPGLEPEQQGDPSAAQGTNLPEYGLEQPNQEAEVLKPASPDRVGRRRRGVVYEKTRSHYDREFIQDNPENVVGLIVYAVGINDPALSHAAEQTLQSMHLVAEAVAKREGTSLNKASRELNISVSRLADFVRKGLVPPLYKDRNTTYIANETAKELGHDKKDAEEMGMQLARLLRERREKYFPKESSF